MRLSKDLVGKAGKNLNPRSKDKRLSYVTFPRKVLMTKHGLDKGSIFKPLTQLRNIGSAMSGKMYVCKCGMIFDSADKFNEHMKEVQRKQLVLPG
ncbi:hypothetical protein AUI07_09165 [archaeon 13_2_20CM_2_53_6]|nr:MAG: hypothetical protein AUI07_09165 [archaeon 13_2_20CM_2_53_6]